MSLIELYKLLKATGLPVAYSHFKVSESNPAPVPPFITYVETETSNFIADNKTYHEISAVDIELYTSKKDLETEALIKKLLDEANIPFQKNEIYVESQEVFKITYEVELI